MMQPVESKKTNTFSKKTLILIPTIEQFQKIVQDIAEPTSPTNKIIEENHPTTPPSNKDQIFVPRYGLLPKPQRPNSKSTPKSAQPILNHGYFRLRQRNNLPDPQKYDLSHSDLQFIATLKRAYDFKKKYKFQPKTFAEIIESCEHNLHKHRKVVVSDDPREILDRLSFNLHYDLKEVLTNEEKLRMEMLFLKVIDYWKKQKVERKLFPLLRAYWPKTDIAMSKYNFWVPFKARVIEEPNKKPPASTHIKNLGHTEKQTNINKKAKDASIFFHEVNDLGELQFTQYSRFKKQATKFHKLASSLGFEKPKYMFDVVDGRQNKDYLKLLNRIQGSAYFRNPYVRLISRVRSCYRPNFDKVFNVAYDPHSKQFSLQQTQPTAINHRKNIISTEKNQRKRSRLHNRSISIIESTQYKPQQIGQQKIVEEEIGSIGSKKTKLD